MPDTTYKDPTWAMVSGAKAAAPEGRADPTLYFEPDWTPKQRKRFVQKFDELAVQVGHDPERDKRMEVVARGLEKRDGPPILRDVAAGLEAGAKEIVNLGVRGYDLLGVASHPSQEGLADTFNRQIAEDAQTSAYADQGDSIPDFVQSGVRGATRSLTQMAATGLAGGGAYTAIGGFAASRANQAVTEANDAGLTGTDKAFYVGRAAAIEGLIAGGFQRLGLGGTERLVYGGPAGVKEFFKQVGVELVEENATEIADAINQAQSGVSGPLTTDQLAQIIGHTTFQTFLASSAAGAFNALSPSSREWRAQQRALRDGLAESYGWKPERVNGLIERAAKRKGDFLDNVGHEIQDEERLTEFGLAEWTAANIDAARALVEAGTPSRKQWEEAGLPRRSDSERADVVKEMSALVEAYDRGAAEATEEQPQQQQEVAGEDSQLAEVPVPAEPTAEGPRETGAVPATLAEADRAAAAQARNAPKRIPLPPEPQAPEVQAPQAPEGHEPIAPANEGWRTFNPKTLDAALARGSIPREQHADAVRFRRERELAAIEEGSRDWRTADADTLAKLLEDFKVGKGLKPGAARARRKQALRRLAILRAEEADWQSASREGIQSLLESGGVHPQDRAAAAERMRSLGEAEEEAGPPAPPAPAPKVRSPVERARARSFAFESGFSRSPRDMELAIQAGIPVGVAAYKKGLGAPLIEQIVSKAADYASNGGRVFVDSGAFSDFMEGIKAGKGPKPTDWRRVMSTYGRIFARVDPIHRRNLFVVAPDVVGNDEATQELQEQFYKTINEWEDAGLSVIVPVQKGGESLSTSWADATDNLKRAEDAIVGVPYNAEAWSKADVVQFVADQARSGTPESPATVRLHLLGGGEKKVADLLDAIEAAGIENVDLHVSGDSRNKAASRRQRGAEVEGPYATEKPAEVERAPLPQTTFALFRHLENMSKEEISTWLKPYVTGKGRAPFARDLRNLGPGVSASSKFTSNLERVIRWRDKSIGAFEGLGELYKALPSLKAQADNQPVDEVRPFLDERGISLPPQIRAMLAAGNQPVEVRQEWLRKFMLEQMGAREFSQLVGEELNKDELAAEEARKARREDVNERLRKGQEERDEEFRPNRIKYDKEFAVKAVKQIKESELSSYQRRGGWSWRKREAIGRWSSVPSVYRHDASGRYVVKLPPNGEAAYAMVEADGTLADPYNAEVLNDALLWAEDAHENDLAELHAEADEQTLTFKQAARADSTWTEENLSGLSKDELVALAQLLGGMPTTGSRNKLRKRLVQTREVRTALAGKTAEEVAATYSEKQLKDFAKKVKTWRSGNKLGIANALVQWRDKARSSGQKAFKDAKTEHAKREERNAFDAKLRALIEEDATRQAKRQTLRALAKESGLEVKEVEERVESVLVDMAREVAGDRSLSDREKFDKLVGYYEKQPKLSTRTSGSAKAQAYSTPIPLAFAAGFAAHVDRKTTLYEPTAGMGALTLLANPKKVHVNELGEVRIEELLTKGFGKVTKASAMAYVPSKKYDRMLANPPFGPLVTTDAKGKEHKVTETVDGYKLSRLDHLIAVKALGAMKDDGLSTLIVGASLEQKKGGPARTSKSTTRFLNYLYNKFNVVGDFVVAGELYGAQGADFPVRVITLAGRRTSSEKQDLAPAEVDTASEWGEVWEKAQEARDVAEAQRARMGADQQGQADDADTGGAGAADDAGAGPQAASADGGKTGRGGRSGAGERGPRGEPAREDGPGAGPDLEQGGGEAATEPGGAGVGEPQGVAGGARGGGRKPAAGGKRRGGKKGGKRADATGVGPKKPVGKREGGFTRNLSDAKKARLAELKQQIQDRINNTRSSGFDFELMGLAAEQGALYVEAGVRNFAEYAGVMLETFGESVKPHLLSWWEATRATVDPELAESMESLDSNRASEIADEVAEEVEQEQEEETEQEEEAEEEAEDGLGDPLPTVKVEEGEEVNERQRKLTTASRGKKLGTVISKMLAPGMVKALNDLQAEVGNVDQFVARKLGYKDLDTLYGALAAEQIDSVALAINNLETGRSLIIGDQTGIGKGRQAAAMLTYAKRQGYMPVFLTADPKLFTDMYNDVHDIGKTVKPLLIGDDKRASIQHPDSTEDNPLPPVIKALTSGTSGAQAKVIEDHLSGAKSIRKKYDAVFMPYSQLQGLATVEEGGKFVAVNRDYNLRQKLLMHLAKKDKVLFVMDESHKAAGESSILGNFMRGGTIKKKIGDDNALLDFSPGALNQDGVKGVVYLSATFAKRPETMPLYFKTALGQATTDAAALMNAFKKGGIALQQWVANALAKGGEMVRRERDFAGVRFETKTIAKDKAAEKEAIADMDRVAEALRMINEYAKQAADVINGMGQQDTARTEQRLTGSEFASVMHNYVAQVLLASKVDAAVAEAKASHNLRNGKGGEASVIVLSNTMESFIDDYADQNGIQPGDPIDVTFADVLQRALDRTMRARDEGDAGGVGDGVVQYTPEQLGLEEEYAEVLDMIREVTDSNLPVSPIDMLHFKLREAGLRTEELTGRDYRIEYSTEGATLAKRSKEEKNNKNAVVNGFQRGEIDVVILNSSGSTGLSLHASEKNPEGDGRRPRHMILAQPDLNIDVVMQALGRILRTGLVGEAKDYARYTLLSSPVQAERRPFAVLSAKLASLNANTTADKESDVQVASLDFINKYGDQVVAEVLAEDDELRRALHLENDVGETRDGQPKPTGQDLARKATGRMAIMSDAQQADFYELVSERYGELIAMLRESGDYDLEVEVQEKWDAKLRDSMELQPETDTTNPFLSGLKLQVWDINDPRKPMKPAELRNALERGFDTRDIGEVRDVLAKRVEEFYALATEREAEYIGPEVPDAPQDASEERKRSTTTRQNARSQRLAAVEKARATVKAEVETLLNVAGKRAAIKVTSGSGQDQSVQDYTGVLVSASLRVPDTGNPWAPGRSKVVFAVESPRRTATFTLSKMASNAYSVSAKREFDGGAFDPDSFARGYNPNVRTMRYVFTGNQISAMTTAGRGNITTFRTSEGEAVTGLVMPAGWTPRKIQEDPRMAMHSHTAVIRLLNNTHGNQSVRGWDSEGKRTAGLEITKSLRSKFHISVANGKNKGGVVYLNQKVIDADLEFVKVGKRWRVEVGQFGLKRAWDVLTELGFTFKAHKATVTEVAEAHGKTLDRVELMPSSPQAPQPGKKGRAGPGGKQKYEVIRTIKRLWPGIAIRDASTYRRMFKVRNAEGWYDKTLGEIRTKRGYDVLVALHELGHHFDRELNAWSKSHGKPFGVRGELLKLGKALYRGHPAPVGGYQAEGFAEFVRMFLTHDSTLQGVAQHTYNWFTTVYLAGNPAEARKIRWLQDDVLKLLTQSSDEEGSAFIRAPARDLSPQRMAAYMAGAEAKLLNDLAPILRGMQATGYDLDQILPEDHPFMLATHYARTAGGRTRNAALSKPVDIVGREYVNAKGLVEILRPIFDQGDEAYHDWKLYAVAKRALTRYHDRGIDPGLSKEAAEDLVRRFEGRPGFLKALRDFSGFAHQALRPLVESGYMTAAEFNRIVAENEFYVPFMRRKEGLEDSAPGWKGKAGHGKAVYKVKDGSNLPIHDPVEAMLLQYEKIQQIAMQHDVVRALVKFSDEARGEAKFLGQFMSPIPDPQEQVMFGAEQIKGQLEAFVDNNGGDLDALADMLDDFWGESLKIYRPKSYQGSKPIVTVVVDGKRRSFEVMPSLVPVMRGVRGGPWLKGYASPLRWATSLQRAGVTGLSPEFGLISNMLRDTMTAFVTAEYHRHIPVASMLHGLYVNKVDPLARHFHSSGMDISGRLGHDVATASASVHEVRTHGTSKLTDRVRARARHPILTAAESLNVVRDLIGATEVSPRILEFVGAWKHAMETYGSEKSAMVLAGAAASDVTINFRSGGSVTKSLNETLLFVNASVLSGEKFARTLGVAEARPWAKEKSRLKVLARTTRRSAFLLTLSALLLWWRNKDDEDWQNLQPHEKWGYFHFKYGDMRAGEAVRIPLPFEHGAAFAALPVAAMEELGGNEGALAEAFKVQASKLLPLDLTSMHGFARSVSLFGPYVDVLHNKDWKGSPIVPGTVQENRVEADWYGARTYELSKDLGPRLGLAPAEFEHMVDGYLGGLYRRVGEYIRMASQDDAVDWEQPGTWPVIQRLFLRPNSSRLVSEFYDRQRHLRQRAGSRVATLEELGEYTQGNQVNDALNGTWAERREVITSGGNAAKRRQAADDLLATAQDQIAAHNSQRDPQRDRKIGMGWLVHRLTDPSAKGDPKGWAVLEGVSYEEAREALKDHVRQAARRRGKKPNFRPRAGNGKLTAWGRRQIRLQRALER